MIFGTRMLSLTRAIKNMITCTQRIIHPPCGAQSTTAMHCAISIPITGTAYATAVIMPRISENLNPISAESTATAMPVIALTST